MASPLRGNDYQKLLKSLEDQGCEIVDKRNGWTIRFPNGKTMGLHRPHGDSARDPLGKTNILRQTVLANGMEWPLNTRHIKKKEPAMPTPVGPKPETRTAVIEAITTLAKASRPIKSSTLAEVSGFNSNAVRRVMLELGWTSEGGRGTSQYWKAPDADIKQVVERLAPQATSSVGAAFQEALTKPAKPKKQYPEIERAKQLVQGAQAFQQEMNEMGMGTLVTTSLVREAEASTALDGETFSVDDIQMVATPPEETEGYKLGEVAGYAEAEREMADLREKLAVENALYVQWREEAERLERLLEISNDNVRRLEASSGDGEWWVIDPDNDPWQHIQQKTASLGLEVQARVRRSRNGQ